MSSAELRENKPIRHAHRDRQRSYSPRVVDGKEFEVDPLGLHLASVKRQHAVIEAAGERYRNFGHATSPARRISGLPMRLVTG